MRLRVIALGWSAYTVMGCAGRQQPYEPVPPPVALEGATCPAGGPAVDILSAQFMGCGKGDTCTVIDQRVRNSTGQSLWLLLDSDDHFFRMVETVGILHPEREPRSTVWEFEGQSVALAVRVPPDTDVLLRNFKFARRLVTFRAVFLDRISIAQYRDVGILAPNGFLPTQGEVDLAGIGGFIQHHRRENLKWFRPMELASISLTCVLDVPVPQ